MKHKITIGKPIEDDDGNVVSYEEVKQIPTNEIHKHRRAGFHCVPEDFDLPELENADDDRDLDDLSVKELKAIAGDLGLPVSGKKGDLIDRIEEARDELAADEDEE